MRESMLVNGILTNSETWYNLLKTEVKELEEVDKLFLRKILTVPESTPGEAFFLELGILPFNVIIKARRINYLHYLLSRDETEMVSIFFFTQWANPTRGDWSEQVKVDLKDFEIPINFDEIKSKSKEAFKRKVKIKAKEYALKILTEKQASHSKMEPLHYSELKMQKYFKYMDTKNTEKRTIFKWRTRMENFGENYREGRDPVMCPLCSCHLDNQSLSTQCEVIKQKVEVKEYIKDIYENDISKETIDTVSSIVEVRKRILNKD